MGASQSFNKIKVNSSVHPYNVFFTDTIKKDLEKEIHKGDILIVDAFILKAYESIFVDIKNDIISILPTENEKSYSEIEKTINQVVAKGFRKKNKLIAVGGGITQDITSFIAFILYRGVSWLFFPTNLLSQCDSCIGSKLSVNLGAYKNLIGGFYPPEGIYIDIGFLKTLDQQNILSGLGEMLHYFLVSGPSDAQLFKQKALEAKKNLAEIDVLIHRSLQIKQAMIEVDEFDQGPRNVFNYGHTFGHALESVTNYSIPHGISVSIGIDLANLISVDLGLISMEERNQMRELCAMVFTDIMVPIFDHEDYEKALKKDKKNVGTDLGLILTKGIGKTFKRITSYKLIEDRVHDFFLERHYLKDF
jgi:3-dehydroquinate synthase